MKERWNYWNRKTHYWATLVILLPALVVIASGLLLQMKKQWQWIQPSTQRGRASTPEISFDAILQAVAAVPEVNLRRWSDIDRLDVQPAKGIVKVQGKNHWEVQVDTRTAEVLQAKYRRSDLIESIHDGSFFHPGVKLWIFLPSGLVLFIMWLTGAWLFAMPLWRRQKPGSLAK